MNEQSQPDNKYLLKQITDEIILQWEQAHGNRATKAHIISGDSYFAIFVSDALSKAERAMKKKSVGNHIIERYLYEIMDWVIANEHSKIEATTGKKVEEQKNYLDLDAGWIMFYFKLGAPISGVNNSSIPDLEEQDLPLFVG